MMMMKYNAYGNRTTYVFTICTTISGGLNQVPVPT
jgi:hypothetical protein